MEAAQASGAEGEGQGDDPRLAGDREPVPQAACQLEQSGTPGDDRGDPLRARQAMGGDPEPEGDDQQRDEGEPEQDRTGHDPADAQDEHGDSGDRHHHHRIDDPLDDDRAEDRRPAHALALAERVAPVQLAEARRQDVVGEVADVRVAEHGPVGQRRDRRQEGPPASAPRTDVDEAGDQHHPDPGRRRRGQDPERRLDVDRADEDPDRDDTDRDAERAAQ